MKAYKEEIRTRLCDYLLTALNARADETGAPRIAYVETGITASPGDLAVTPALYLFVGGRNVSQDFFDTYECRFGVCFPCATPQEGEAMADKWEDIIEDVLRSDRSLGDACLTWTGEPSISSMGEPGVWMTLCDLTIEKDLGGDV